MIISTHPQQLEWVKVSIRRNGISLFNWSFLLSLLLIIADSIFKSRDITLPTKVRLVKAMVFPVVMYGCESWTVKKAEH